MEPSYYSGRTLSPVISQGDARAELPSAGRVDHRQPGLLSLRVQRLPYPGQGGPGEEARDAIGRGKEYHRKTTGPHQMWATDASYFRVVGWGYYYLVTVMDVMSRFIKVVQDAVDRTVWTKSSHRPHQAAE